MLLTETDLKGFTQTETDVLNKNDDHDFGEVLRTCRIGEPKTRGHMLRYADGQERAFSFDD